jgi:hypothetical protein
MSKKTKRPDRVEMRRRTQAEAAAQADSRLQRELRNSIIISTIVFLTFWFIILIGVTSEGLWGLAT